MNSRRQGRILAYLKKAEELYKSGMDCLWKKPDCCGCNHDDSYTEYEGKPSACSCGQCKRWQCKDCPKTVKDGKHELCTVMLHMQLEE